MERFNALPSSQAEDRLYACLANQRWAAAVAAGRPYADLDSLIDKASSEMGRLTDEEWLAAMRAHPRIGERGGDSPEASAREQSAAMGASPETLGALAAENLQYEQKFGHVFLIFASGRTGEEILVELRRRMKNDGVTELAEATAELRKIARLRLEKLVSP
ncbi:MAG TPA: 2-oxo-4-hydroxy-4-carboxy-5-ureidoimidazoline decarboxylase [Candidatus Dormibacteraeota bacterium]|nr:2-oxo-4-hydroxy-4-carboxy-5-ureidoimidazoline decarboxylase [Candidatus Dormibacteraeota bacterium]